MPTTNVFTLVRAGKLRFILLLNIQPATSSRKSWSQVPAGVCRTEGPVTNVPAPPLNAGSRKSLPSCSPVAGEPAVIIPSVVHLFATWQGPTPAAVHEGLP